MDILLRRVEFEDPIDGMGAFNFLYEAKDFGIVSEFHVRIKSKDSSNLPQAEEAARKRIYGLIAKLGAETIIS
ncbi:hypothetical protein [Rhizobium sp. HT1-10]|uniref:hypothetical protein n=1 Tax=Rhizobium sp. HT1-10 TaxID=3111638 RepID=UPI003C1F7DD1